MTSAPARLSRVRFGARSAAACLLMVACTSGPIGEADGELVIGTMLPLTGDEADQGSAARAALDDQLVGRGAYQSARRTPRVLARR